MTLVQIRHFIALAKAGSFVKASKLLCITQPALSRSIKSLEDEMGRLLFDRIGRRIELTSFGRDVLARGQALVNDAEQIRNCGRQLLPGDSGQIRLGLGSGPGAMLNLPVMAHFAKHFPHFHVEVVRANTDSLVQMLRDRSLEACVLDIRNMLPAPDLRVTDIVEMDAAFMCRPGHPLAATATLTFEDIAAYPVASTPMSEEVIRILVERYGAKAHRSELVKFTCDEVSQIIKITETTDAILFVIRAAAPHLVELQLKPPVNVKGRYGLVTIANKAEALFLPEIRKLINALMRSEEPQ